MTIQHHYCRKFLRVCDGTLDSFFDFLTLNPPFMSAHFSSPRPITSNRRTPYRSFGGSIATSNLCLLRYITDESARHYFTPSTWLICPPSYCSSVLANSALILIVALYQENTDLLPPLKPLNTLTTSPPDILTCPLLAHTTAVSRAHPMFPPSPTNTHMIHPNLVPLLSPIPTPPLQTCLPHRTFGRICWSNYSCESRQRLPALGVGLVQCQYLRGAQKSLLLKAAAQQKTFRLPGPGPQKKRMIRTGRSTWTIYRSRRIPLRYPEHLPGRRRGRGGFDRRARTHNSMPHELLSTLTHPIHV